MWKNKSNVCENIFKPNLVLRLALKVKFSRLLSFYICAMSIIESLFLLFWRMSWVDDNYVAIGANLVTVFDHFTVGLFLDIIKALQRNIHGELITNVIFQYV